MALDGIALASIVSELKKSLLNGRIDKISQPEKDELFLSVRSFGSTYKLLLTANPTHPRLHLTDAAKNNPLTAPLFCMVLRKYLANGKIVQITQPSFERIVVFHIESANELGDLSAKRLIIEVMGKHSNIILIDEHDTILDAIKHISFEKSSVREVLPAKKYFFPPSGKADPLNTDYEQWRQIFSEKKSQTLQSLIYKSYNGISPVMATEICFRAGLSESSHGEELSSDEIKAVWEAFDKTFQAVRDENFHCEIIYGEAGKIIDFFSLQTEMFKDGTRKIFETPSRMLAMFYSERDVTYRISQKTQDLRKLIMNHMERCVKKKEIQQKTLEDIEGREKLKLYGELITANIYAITQGMTEVSLANFYEPDYKEISVRLDPLLTPVENAQKYFKRYNKQKRTFAALEIQMKQNNEEYDYLESILNSLSVSAEENDIEEIREELYEQGFIKKRSKAKKKPAKTKPLRFRSSDGFEIYVGKNNKQNDELTTKTAKGNDIWLHTKDIPGSHVIIKTDGKPVPDTTLEEAVLLAAWYSKARSSSSVAVDYTARKNVKKPNGAKPDMVIYENNRTAYVTPTEESIKKLIVF